MGQARNAMIDIWLEQARGSWSPGLILGQFNKILSVGKRAHIDVILSMKTINHFNAMVNDYSFISVWLTQIIAFSIHRRVP